MGFHKIAAFPNFAPFRWDFSVSLQLDRQQMSTGKIKQTTPPDYFKLENNFVKCTNTFYQSAELIYLSKCFLATAFGLVIFFFLKTWYEVKSENYVQMGLLLLWNQTYLASFLFDRIWAL